MLTTANFTRIWWGRSRSIRRTSGREIPNRGRPCRRPFFVHLPPHQDTGEAFVPETPLAGWESFYVILGSSAAALTGLQFVVMALVADSPLVGSGQDIAIYGTPSVVHFCSALLVSAILSAPWPGLEAVHVPLVLTAAAGVIYMVVVIRRARARGRYQPVMEDWIWHTMLPLVAYAVLSGAALELENHPTGAL